MRRGLHPRLVPAVLAAAALVALVVIIAGSRGSGTTVRLSLDDAAGLQNGSPVSVGGVAIGKISLKLGRGDKVLVDAHLRDGKSVPKNARVAVTAVNFLGAKQVSFVGGDRSQPAPDGYTFASSRITTSTDLDQVFDTLDPGTRTRLAILLNEAGASVLGRRWDISHFVQEAPTTLADADALLDRLITDNHTLADLVGSSDRFVAATTGRRAALVRMIDTLGKTAETVQTRRAALRATLAKAPGTLTTLRHFLGELQRTTVPLGPAARDITRAAPALSDTLAQVDGFRTAASPTLRTAAKVAPTLTRLATGATPVLRRALAPVTSLATLADALKPVSRTLDGSADNLTAVLENWSQAIQLRDGVSHIFRGEATFSPDLLTSVLDRVNKPADKPVALRRVVQRPRDTAPLAPATAPATPTARPNPTPLDALHTATDGVGRTAQDLLKKLLPGIGAPAAQAPPAGVAGERPKSASALLDFLLGS